MEWSPSMRTSGSTMGTRPASCEKAAKRARARPFEDLRERGAVGGLLADGLVKEDHAGEVLANAPGGEEHLSVLPAALLGGVDVDRVKALLYGAEALVGGEDALALGHELLGGALKLL